MLMKIGAAIVAVAAAGAACGRWLAPYDPLAQELSLRLAGPSLGHPFGLDELGRDILARVLAGAQISFLVSVIVVSISATIGTLIGALGGYFGGILDDVIGRTVDLLLAFPGLLLAVALVAVLGPSFGNVLVALTVVGWVAYARLVRGLVLRTRELEYVQAAKALGAGWPRVLFRHVVPSVLPSVAVQGALGMAGAVIGEAALSFLGLGVQAPTPSWGTMLSGGRAHLLDAPHLTVFPGLAMALLVAGFTFLGDGFRELAAEPRRRQP
jgi:peptide/nickel transport system permease protein